MAHSVQLSASSLCSSIIRRIPHLVDESIVPYQIITYDFMYKTCDRGVLGNLPFLESSVEPSSRKQDETR
jgi:hypothetical protein